MKSYSHWLAILPLFFPFYLVKLEVFGIPTTLLEVLIGVVALVGIGGFLRLKSFRSWFLNQKRNWVWKPSWPVLLFLIAATVSMLIVPLETLDVNGDSVESARIAQGVWKAWIVMPMVYFFMLIVGAKDRGFWTNTCRALLVSGLALSIWAVYQMVTGDYLTIDGRASGPFESANYLSLYLAPILFFAFVDGYYKLKSKEVPVAWKALWLLVVLVMMVAFWGTQSYAGFIALGVGIVFYGMLHPHIPKRHKWTAFGLGLIVALGLLFTQVHTEKFQEFLDFENRTSSSVRIEVYEIATTLIAQHPISGIGLGQFEVQYQVNAPIILGQPPYEWVMIHPHNLFFAFWLNVGLFGLLAMVWLLFIAFVQGWPQREGFLKGLFSKIDVWRHGPNLNYRWVALAMLVVILTHGLFDTPFWKNDLAYLWWFVLAMIFVED
ncbi:MAG: O-antigen ligase family protein [Candidatus Peregrinibacteria bacterium]|nr:O-antigen ligase family protein [Candidatus Peregrinibacteria bacterium]